ncbi:MAG TPA: tetratricopeptide repeat protein [Candidatus Angelobacter sp.]|nr:tetratricopeptide repeat protein [Candidatus Angelobacter sp.]
MKTKRMYGVITALLLALGAIWGWSQATSGKVVGRITSQGKPVANALITLTNTGTGRSYKIKADKDGSFSAVGISFGEYDQEISDASGEKLLKRKVSVTGNQGAVKGESGAPDDLSVDVGGGSGPKMSEEELAKLKAEREKGLNLNALISQYNAAQQAKNWQQSADLLKQMIAMDPNRWDFEQALGDMNLNLGQYEESVAAYEKAIPAAENAAKTDAKADPAKIKMGIAKMLNNEGSAYLKLKQPQKAVDAYTKAASLDPNPGTAYFNLCATQYNSGNTQGALAACDKAIAADPNRADAYYIKGSLLVGDSKLDKEGKLMAPPGTSEALNKYLELAPDGAHAADVKQMLAAIGAKIETTYKEKKKK